jgi:hypothetical protein
LRSVPKVDDNRKMSIFLSLKAKQNGRSNSDKGAPNVHMYICAA